MNRKQKIIISVVGITIVLLALLGITYAYYLTRIEGNTNINSISITTADLSLKWIDGTNNLINSDSAIIPGEFSSSMNFSVKNNGNSNIDEYAVALEEFSVVYAANSGKQIAGVRTNLVYPEDFKLVITCESDNSNDCNGLNGILPTTNEILLTNSINIGETQTYTVTLTYVDSGTDQSADMNKLINGKLNIIDTQNTINLIGSVTNHSAGDYIQTNSVERKSSIDSNNQYKIVGLEPGEHTIRVFSKDGVEKASKKINIINGEENGIDDSKIIINDQSDKIEININATSKEFDITEVIQHQNPFEEDTLAYLILDNAFKGYGNRTVYKPTPMTTPSETTQVLENERTLSNIPENDGISYYFRGNVEDNYVNFAGMCWRAVRIQDDGSVKLMLASANGRCQDVGALSDTSGYDGTSIYTGSGAGAFYYDVTYNISLTLEELFNNYSDRIVTNNSWCYSNAKELFDIEHNIFNDDIYFGEYDAGYSGFLSQGEYTYYFDSFFEREVLNLNCDNKVQGNFATLTKKETILAGLGNNSFLLDNAKNGFDLLNYLSFDGDLSGYSLDYDGNFGFWSNDGSVSFVPVIVLKSDVLVEGIGTVNFPYKLIKTIDISGALWSDTITIVEGMTWKEWANSKYSKEYIRVDDKIILGYADDYCDTAYTQTYYIDANSEEIITSDYNVPYYGDEDQNC